MDVVSPGMRSSVVVATVIKTVFGPLELHLKVLARKFAVDEVRCGFRAGSVRQIHIPELARVGAASQQSLDGFGGKFGRTSPVELAARFVIVRQGDSLAAQQCGFSDCRDSS